MVAPDYEFRSLEVQEFKSWGVGFKIVCCFQGFHLQINGTVNKNVNFILIFILLNILFQHLVGIDDNDIINLFFMRKYKFILIFSLSVFGISLSFSQDWRGFTTGNYAGINSLFLQPANIVDSRFVVDCNLLSTDLSLGNNYYYIKWIQ